MPGPSAWVEKHAAEVTAGGAVLDLACGSGRHTGLFLGLGHPVAAVDRDLSRMPATPPFDRAERIAADLEGGPWPLGELRFAGIVVTNYLHRPLFPRILASLAPGGVLIYETFALGNERFGRPSNPAFLLHPGELIDICHGPLTIRAYEFGEVAEPKLAVVQRICAIKPE